VKYPQVLLVLEMVRKRMIAKEVSDHWRRMSAGFVAGLVLPLDSGDHLANARPLRPEKRDATKRKRDDQDANNSVWCRAFRPGMPEIHDIGVISFISCRQCFSAPAGR
jgi:hypothetical protein